MTNIKDLVLVTGGSGFVGSHTALAALSAGYRVRTTVRSLQRADAVRQMLLNGDASKEQVGDVEFIAANLTSDEGWTEACKDCTYVLHVASPFPAAVPKDENDLIIPARDGTLRVLRAAKAAGTVKRIVITSSMAAIGYGHPVRTGDFTEKDWSVLESSRPVAPYPKSKTIAERAAWAFIEKEGNGLELSTINPVGILGPVLSKSSGTSVDIIISMLQGKTPMLPKLLGSWVDVRDVAQLHIKAMISPEANGERFLVSAGEATISQIAAILKERLGSEASKVSTREVPNFVLRIARLWDKRVDLIIDEVANPKHTDCTKAKTVLDWTPISVDEAVVTSAESAMKYGLV